MTPSYTIKVSFAFTGHHPSIIHQHSGSTPSARAAKHSWPAHPPPGPGQHPGHPTPASWTSPPPASPEHQAWHRGPRSELPCPIYIHVPRFCGVTVPNAAKKCHGFTRLAAIAVHPMAQRLRLQCCRRVLLHLSGQLSWSLHVAAGLPQLYPTLPQMDADGLGHPALTGMIVRFLCSPGVRSLQQEFQKAGVMMDWCAGKSVPWRTCCPFHSSTPGSSTLCGGLCALAPRGSAALALQQHSLELPQVLHRWGDDDGLVLLQLQSRPRDDQGLARGPRPGVVWLGSDAARDGVATHGGPA